MFVDREFQQLQSKMDVLQISRLGKEARLFRDSDILQQLERRMYPGI